MARGDDDTAIMAIDEAPGVVATPDRIAAWMAVAKTGDEFVYATRCFLPLGSTGAAAMRELAERGMVFLYQRSAEGGSRHFSARNYVARRSSLPFREPPSASGPAPVKGRGRGNADVDAINAVLPLLQRAARFARPCPTDAHMASRAGLTAAEVAGAILSLCDANVIRVRAMPAPTLRMVTIVATGHRTGLVQGKSK